MGRRAACSVAAVFRTEQNARGSSFQRMRHTLIIGDIHACAAELEELLSRAAVTEDDQVLCVGDLVSRGPDARGVLRLLRTCRARSVMGNHDARLLEARRARE